MELQNARLLIGEEKAVLTPVRFEGAHSALGCKGTITVPKACGFLPEMLNGLVYIDDGDRVYRVTRTWDTRLEGDNYVIGCFGVPDKD